MNYLGTIIEESLGDKSVLKDLNIISTKIEPITDRHQTPWLDQWTLYKVEIPEKDAENVANSLGQSLDREHDGSWYADYKNDTTHFIIFRNKVFKIDRTNADQYREATDYGLSLGIPDYQVDFKSNLIKS